MRTKKKKKTKLCHHHVISMVCSLIEHGSQPINAQEIAKSVIVKIINTSTAAEMLHLKN